MLVKMQLFWLSKKEKCRWISEDSKKWLPTREVRVDCTLGSLHYHLRQVSRCFVIAYLSLTVIKYFQLPITTLFSTCNYSAWVKQKNVAGLARLHKVITLITCWGSVGSLHYCIWQNYRCFVTCYFVLD